nr:FUSC family protein [Shewanella algae]
MALSPTLAVFLTPDKRTLIFAIKGVIAMALALTAALYLDLERPYWALVSAVFLQMRPESGLVLEKGLCQIIGTLVGGVVGIAILSGFYNAPELAILTLTLWLGLNSALSAMVRHINFVYAFAMAGITPCLIVLLVMVNPATANSETIFAVAHSRVSEIIVGAICATLVSQLLWPVRVTEGLQKQTRKIVNQTLEYLTLELDLNGSHENRHQQIDAILESLAEASDDANALSYEGPEGPGRSRAANLLFNKVLSLLAVIQIFGRLQRNHEELMTGTLSGLIRTLKSNFKAMSESDDFHFCYELAHRQRREIIHYRNTHACISPLESRLLKTASELASDLVLVLRAFKALESPDKTLLNAPAMQTHRDPLLGLITGVRTMLIFLIGAGIWIGTASSAALMIMTMPVIFSIMMARLPLPLLSMILRRLLIGVMIAIPVAIFYALELLAQSSGDIEIMLLVLAGPFFIGLMALANRATLPYGLGFCIPFAILVSPSKDMTQAFAIDSTLSKAMAIFVGVSILYWLFKLVTEPGVKMMQQRLLNATRKDLIDMVKQDKPEDWFNARMADRLLRLANYERSSQSSNRTLTDLGLTGLNLGHVSVRLRRLLASISDSQLDELLQDWQLALANAFILCSRGENPPEFRASCERLLARLQTDGLAQEQLEMVQGMFERLIMTFERSAAMISNANAPATQAESAPPQEQESTSEQKP